MRITAAGVLLLAAFSAEARAQLVPCDVNSPGYKVLLDDVVYSGSASPSESKVLMDRLRMKLWSDLEALRVETRLPLLVVRCEGRRPRNEGDFRIALVDALNTQNVLLEVWGSVLPGDNHSVDMLIGFALIPVRFYERNAPSLGVHMVNYATRSSDAPQQLLQLFSRSAELKAFVLVAGGTKAFREKRYNEAYDCLCASAQVVRKLRPGRIASAQELLDYASRFARETVQTANRDTAYSGTLRLIDPADPAQLCGGQRP